MEVFGTGTPLRQFCYAPDLAFLMLWVAFTKTKLDLIALVPEDEQTIGELAQVVAREFSLREVRFDPSRADGQHRKTMSNKTLRSLLPNFKFTPL